jgi:hypothetical protein
MLRKWVLVIFFLVINVKFWCNVQEAKPLQNVAMHKNGVICKKRLNEWVVLARALQRVDD